MSGSDFLSAVSRFETVVAEEMREWEIGGVAVAVIEGGDTVYAKGFGEARRDSVFRVGSISKLFNAVMIMREVEAGRLDLDAPLPPDLLPINPFPDAPSVTLRQILCHRSGLQREAPVGGYFDGSEPGLEATVASVRPCVLVTRPGEMTRYSNIAPSIAGFHAARVAGEGFGDYQRRNLLEPLGMTSSHWTLDAVEPSRLIVSRMRVTDGEAGWRRIEAPVFDLGTIPAGNLFSTVDDLARFAAALLDGGGPLLGKEALAEMWRPQLTDKPTGFGLGFAVGEFRGTRTISHSGAVFGHSASFALVPDRQAAVIVLGNEDIVGGRIARISREAMEILLEEGGPRRPAAPAPPLSPLPSRERLEACSGDFLSQSYWARLEVVDGRLTGDLSGQPTRFTAKGGMVFTADSRILDAAPTVFEIADAGEVTGFTLAGQTYRRVDTAKQGERAALPAEWRRFLGRYGPDFIPLVVRERHGRLFVTTENMVDYRLTPVNRRACALPPGMYVEEQVVFLTNREGEVSGVDFANMVFARQP